jgi:DNA repair protein RecO (recombination protein O)
MQVYSSEAVVLRHIDYGEADRIVTFFACDCGRIKGFARGARKSRKRFGAALEPFARVILHWSPSRSGDMVTLKEAELLDLRAGLRRDLAAIALAGYGCELVETLLAEGQGQVEVFNLLQAFLDQLSAHGAALESRLLFELRILNLVGYAPHLLHCSECGETLRSEEVAFDASRGGSLCLACARSRVSLRVGILTLGTLARSLKAPVTLFEGFHLSSRTLREGGAVLSDALQLHLPQPLRSLPFMEQILSGEDFRRNL